MFLLMVIWVLMMGKVMGIEFTSMCMMLSRVGEDQEAVGSIWDECRRGNREGKTKFRTLHLYAGPRLPALEPA